MSIERVAVIWERFGEYHHARLERASRDLEIAGIEVASKDQTYQWAVAKRRPGYSLCTLNETMHVPLRTQSARLLKTLSSLNPAVVAVPGWSRHYALCGICWAHDNRKPVILMSDSNEFDTPRTALRERCKSGIVASASAGFAAGATSSAYLRKLGLPPSRIHTGYNAVDNAHFARIEGAPARRRSGFLTVARFVPRKNLHFLLAAYCKYLELCPANGPPWRLTLVGDGPQLSGLQAKAAALGIANLTSFPGFSTYAKMPKVYQDAGVFILPSRVEQWGLVVNEAMAAGLPVLVSSAAGSARDLVAPGKNGAIFDPLDCDTLARQMCDLAGADDRRARMGKESKRIIAQWDLDRFSRGLAAAVEVAKRTGPPTPKLIDRAILRSIGMIRQS